MKEFVAGNLVEVISTKKLAMITSIDYRVATVEIIESGREVMYMFDNLKLINSDVTIENIDSPEVENIKKRYVKWIAGMPKNYKQDWTVEHIQIVAEELNKKKKEDRDYLMIKLGLKLERTKGGVQWLWRRLFRKAGRGISITKRIEKVIDELGLLGG